MMSPVLTEQSALGRLARQILHQAQALTAAGMPVLSLLIILNAYAAGFLDRALIIVCSALLAFPLLWLVRNRMPLNVVAALFLALLGLTAAFVFLRLGLTTSSGAISVLMIVLSGLFFGRNGSLWSLLFILILLTLCGILVINGWVAPISPTSSDPYNRLTWVRAAVALGLFGVGVAIAVIHVVESMKRENAALQQALQREADERRAREIAEAERETARVALAEAQRLESIGRLAGGVAHDFNNILTVIMGCTELALQERRIDAHVRNYLAEIQHATQQSVALTQELLLLSRRDIVPPQVIDLAEFFGRMGSTLRRIIPVDITLTFDFTRAEGARVRLVPISLERVVMNLVSNARDAIVGSGTIRISVAVRRAMDMPAGGGRVLLTVSDSGSGLDEDTRSRMFEPFFTTKHIGRGSGLGLTLVQSMVLDASGTIDVQSEPGRGTSITLSLPLAEDALTTPAVSPIDDDGHASNAGRGYTVFIVDDQLPVLATIMACLERVGFSVLTSHHGDDALQQVRDPGVKFDLLCLDGVIPGASSAAIHAAMRIHRPDIPIVLCSGYIDEELLLRGIQVGELTCVRKPFHPNELVAVILKELGLGTNDSPPPQQPPVAAR